ncbi:uncharacterized protein RCH25_017622 [Pelodytes ibericus]
MFSLQNSGSMVLLTNTATMSNKLLSLANPRPKAAWICQNVSVTMPSIATVWYLPISLVCHIYLAYTCIREMTNGSCLTSAAQVLLAISMAAILLFTAFAVLKVERSAVVPDSGYKHSRLNHSLEVLRSQKYALHALSAFLLINSYLLLQISKLCAHPSDRGAHNGTMDTESHGFVGNITKVNVWMVLYLLPLENRITYIEYCVYFAVPMICHSIQESDPIWRNEKLWGFLYSTALLMSAVKYLSSTFAYFFVSLTAYLSPQSILIQGSPMWVPVLYSTSLLSVFLYTLSVKCYVDLCFRVPISSSSVNNLTLRRKIRPYPSPLGVVLSTLLIVACEIPSMVHLINFLLRERKNDLIVFLFVLSVGFGLFCVSTSLIVGLRRNCRPKKHKLKHSRVESGVCLANSFVYQSSPNSGKTSTSGEFRNV